MASGGKEVPCSTNSEVPEVKMVQPGYPVPCSCSPTFFSGPFSDACGLESRSLAEALLTSCAILKLCIHLLPDARIASHPHWEGQEVGY